MSSRQLAWLLFASVGSACGGTARQSPAHGAQSAVAPVAPVSTSCPEGSSALMSDTLYFGSKKKNADQSWVTVVTPEVWEQFAQTELAAAFPEGSTSWAAKGMWKAPSEELVTVLPSVPAWA